MVEKMEVGFAVSKAAWVKVITGEKSYERVVSFFLKEQNREVDVRE